MSPIMTTQGIKSASSHSYATVSLGAGASTTPSAARVITAIQKDNVAGALGVELQLDDGTTWVQADDISGTAVQTNVADQPTMLPSALTGGTRMRLTTGAGATQVISYYYWTVS